MNKRVEFLIISSTIDYSTDYVCVELKKRQKAYLRINRDQFNKYQVHLDVLSKTMLIQIDSNIYEISERYLRAIYFRAPVFIRSGKTYSVDRQLYRSQWSSFIRNLTIFDHAKWINHPATTYQAESKVYQLVKAVEVGLIVPETKVVNSVPCDLDPKERYAVKALDTALFYNGRQEMFTYTTMLTGAEIAKASLSEAPIILQESIEDKIDLRVTIVGEQVFPAEITKSGKGIDGDWRKTPKENLQYRPAVLPVEIESKLLRYMKLLGLTFGGIDLMYSRGQYYFVEVNPTGEWGWLVETTGFPIYSAIVDVMEG